MNQNKFPQIPNQGNFLTLHLSPYYGLTFLIFSHDKVVVCYVRGRAGYRLGNGELLVENFDPMLCTHIIYAFAVLDINVNHSIQSMDPYLDTEEKGGKGK